jgi:hypothetical protein
MTKTPETQHDDPACFAYKTMEVLCSVLGSYYG